jgi:hypothetical protein
MSRYRCHALLVTVLAVTACGDNFQQSADAAPDADGRDILVRLQALPGVTAEELQTSLQGYRAFALTFDQIVDYAAPAQHFSQHATLIHRDIDAPLIIATTGYGDYLGDRRSELTRIANGNQVSIEHRYFGPSRPSPADWSKLTVVNAATDEHRIIQALRTIYRGAAATTGGSKGGMTAIFHRRFFPDDVDAAFPFVAPLSQSDQDPRYMAFLMTVGPTVCREQIRNLQVEMLSRRRAALIARATAEANQRGLSYTRVSIAASVESSVASLDWAFWQYRGVASCSTVPELNASDEAMWQFLLRVVPVSDNADDSIADFDAYYYQAAFELGQPTAAPPHLTALLQFTDADYSGLLPVGVAAPTFTAAPMVDIDAWLTSQGQRMMLVYGQWDPWTAGAFRLGNASDSYIFTQAQGTHGSSLAGLDAADRVIAANKIQQWLKVTPLLATARLSQDSADREPEIRHVPSAMIHARRLPVERANDLVLQNTP